MKAKKALWVKVAEDWNSEFYPNHPFDIAKLMLVWRRGKDKPKQRSDKSLQEKNQRVRVSTFDCVQHLWVFSPPYSVLS